MKNHRTIRLPYDRYNESLNLQKQLMKKQGIKIPLWRCNVAIEEKRRRNNNNNFDIESFFEVFK